MPSETVQSDVISLTPSAVTQLKRIMAEQNVPEGYGLRVGVKGGGCSGFSYILGFDARKEKDQVYEIAGLPVFIERTQGMYLLGMEVDWHDGLNNRGFIFNNPNADETCGCGSFILCLTKIQGWLNKDLRWVTIY